LIVFLGSTQDFKIPTKVLPSPARPFFMDGMDACFETLIKKTALGANPGGFLVGPKRLYALAAGAALR
jgi:hypothetical protein